MDPEAQCPQHKAGLADTFAIWADGGFGSGETLNFFEAWVTSLSYTFQPYFDFSGYCDMAVGASLLFNIRLPDNFNSPYKATSIQDFWRRWHITLSNFLRSYVYQNAKSPHESGLDDRVVFSSVNLVAGTRYQKYLPLYSANSDQQMLVA
jgi:D-alanyl-lipoteichoic acid acyltransferase DltB (MBOAT superfamily)